MKKLIITTGDRFGRLVILNEVEKRGNFRYFLCKCDCGNKKIIAMNSFVRKRTTSCGCYWSEVNKSSKPQRRKNKRGIHSEVLYSRWLDMRKRCYSKNSRAYKWYGANGVKMCKEWSSEFNNFYDWAIDNNFSPNLTIERIDFNGNYAPDNCTLIPLSQQNSNKSSNRVIEYMGFSSTLSDWSKVLGISYTTLCGRLNRNWSVKETFETPVDRRFGKRK